MTDIKVGAEAHETVSARIVESNVTRITYDMNDPYDTPEEHAEGMFIGKWLAKYTGDDSGFCSTYREWHIFRRGMSNGFNTVLTGKFEKCPEMWQDESHYYEGGQELGYVLRNAFIFILSGSISTELLLNSNTIISVISRLIGV